jgi:hypothetical protein
LHPDRLVVERPIEQVRVAGLFEQIGRDVGFERARAHPTRGPHDEVFFMISVHSWNLFGDLRIVIADSAVQKNRRGQFQRARRNCASSADGAKIAFSRTMRSYVERSRGECIKQEITARSPKMTGCSSTA